MKPIILGIICSILNYLPFNYYDHLYILNNMFNTKIFQNEIIVFLPLCFLPIFIPTKKITKNIFKIYLPLIPIFILKLIVNIKINNPFILSFFLLIYSIILLITTILKPKNNNINYLKIFFINLFSILPSISILYTFYISIKNTNLKNKLKLSLFPYLINNIFYIHSITINHNQLLTIIISLLTTIIIFYLIKPKKIWKISLYSLITSILFLIFFR